MRVICHAEFYANWYIGFVRIGRLVLRVLWDRENIEITNINDQFGDANSASLLIEFD